MNKAIIAIVSIAVVAFGGYFLLRGSYQPATPVPQSSSSQQPTTPTSATKQPSQQPPTSQAPVAKENVITYTNNGYSSAILEINQGETVTFENQSSKSMWTASDVHPSHTAYDGTSLSDHCGSSANTAFDTCKGIQPGSSWSFKFDEVGTWKYHNHLSPNDTGTIVVK